MKFKFAALIVALLFTLISGCTTTSVRPTIGIKRVAMPDWARTGNHPDYPLDKFLVGVGYSKAGFKAGKQAEESIEFQISKYAIERGKQAISGSKFERLVTNSAQWFRAGEFDRAVKEDRATDGFDFVVIRAIKKSDLHTRAQIMLPKVQKELHKSLSPKGMVGNVPDALRTYADWFVLNMRVVCLQLLADGSLDRTAFESAEEAAITLWEFPTIATVIKKGEKQRAQIRGGLADPLSLQIIYQGRIVDGLPLKWSLVAGQMGGVRGDLITDRTGIASARVMQISANGSAIGLVQAYPDLTKIAGRRIGLSLSAWMWEVKLPNRDSAALRLNVSEGSNGDELSKKFEEKFRVWAKANGYTVISADAATDEYGWILDISGSIEIQTWMRDGIPQVRVSGNIAIEDTSNGRTLFRLNPGGIGAGNKGNTEFSVSLRAQSETADSAVAETSSRIQSFLPSPDAFGMNK